MRLEAKKQNRWSSSEAVVHLPIREIVPDPCGPHRVLSFDELTRRAAKIAVEGVARPLTVRDLGGVYQLVGGELTLKAAAMAGFTHVPCVVSRRSLAPTVPTAEERRRESARAYFAQLASLAPSSASAPSDDLAPYPLTPRSRCTPVIRDLRLLTNTVRRACQALNAGGICAELEQSETADELCLVVRVPKQAVRPSVGE